MNCNISLPERLALSVNGWDFSCGELADKAGRVSGWLSLEEKFWVDFAEIGFDQETINTAAAIPALVESVSRSSD